MDLRRLYREKEQEIKGRLRDFEMAGYRPPRELFPELCFCLLTPGTKAEQADRMIKHLVDTGLLYQGSEQEIAKVLQKRVRFHNAKARHIVAARALLADERFRLALLREPAKAREFLVRNVRGMGYKEASHFLRNVGKGEGLAILDRHVLRNLVQYRALQRAPASMTPQRYLEIEEKVRSFARKLGIPMEELDLLLWSKETGRIFK
ncbi:MAG: N-glycosylase/DNA lyase [Candidatus Aenigmarchaeota archaeon]|nr:N-glycosylase/DNA lyase [Candidatus Aenigmarchaeota archaeon]